MFCKIYVALPVNRFMHENNLHTIIYKFKSNCLQSWSRKDTNAIRMRQVWACTAIVLMLPSWTALGPGRRQEWEIKHFNTLSVSTIIMVFLCVNTRRADLHRKYSGCTLIKHGTKNTWSKYVLKRIVQTLHNLA